MKAIFAGAIMVLIGFWHLLDRARLGLIHTRALGQYFGGRGPEEEPTDEAVAPIRGWYAFSGVCFLVIGVIAIISGAREIW